MVRACVRVCACANTLDGPHGCLSVWLPADNNNNDDDDGDGGGGDDDREADADADDDDERRPGGRERAGQPAETGERMGPLVCFLTRCCSPRSAVCVGIEHCATCLILCERVRA